MQKLLSKLRKSIQDFNMIQDGDRIAVGLSGGKDSNLLLYALKQYQRFSPQPFELCAITIDMGLKELDLTPLIEFTKKIDVPHYVVKTSIAEIIFDIRKEKNPCSLCAKMRRGALHDAAKNLGCNKVALAHHLNDVIETFLMSMFFEGRLSTFSPVTHLEKKDIYLIRPLVYVYEKDIRSLVKKNNLPVIKNPCPANGNTQRQNMKELIWKLEKQIPGIKDNILGAITNLQQLNVWDKDAIRKICDNKKI
ncbi:tRNA 2-thiocytidine biosynthesis protein TtcA [Caloramator mitchellensis]|uniref:tRNA 2-thiocytidine biosynthesis protein TtcA n=1 Tax=Caloramator mitchellensis TaxID=908809 RepID=A0A0R3JZL7_CALMK|nr:ATP-binding protein [Caloramator mitchellensis]KRQ87725.1 tRNA 2-thiocytidine biosynthesis protein TtcA [Caloramator mitchellensis]